MKDPRRPLEVHESRDLLLTKIRPHVPIPPARYTAEEMQEVLAHTPMGQSPDQYADFYFLSQMRVGARH